MFKTLRQKRGFPHPFSLLVEAGWRTNEGATYYRLERDGAQQRTTLGSLRKVFQVLHLKAPLSDSEKLQIFDSLILEVRDEPRKVMEAEVSTHHGVHSVSRDPPQP